MQSNKSSSIKPLTCECREAQQKRLQDKMQAVYLAAVADQEARLAKDVRLAEEKADTSAADKAAERQQGWEEIQR